MGHAGGWSPSPRAQGNIQNAFPLIEAGIIVFPLNALWENAFFLCAFPLNGAGRNAFPANAFQKNAFF